MKDTSVSKLSFYDIFCNICLNSFQLYVIQTCFGQKNKKSVKLPNETTINELACLLEQLPPWNPSSHWQVPISLHEPWLLHVKKSWHPAMKREECLIWILIPQFSKLTYAIISVKEIVTLASPVILADSIAIASSSRITKYYD